MQRRAGRVWLVLWVIGAVAPAVAQTPRIISTEQLAGQLGAEGQYLIDMRDDIRAYWAGHIPGAQWVSPEAIRWPDGGVPGKLMPCDQLAKLLSTLGVTTDSTVVIYAEESNFKPTYLAWALDYLGHKPWAILDGGFSKWAAEQRTVTQEYPRVFPCPCFTYVGPRNDTRLTTAQVLQMKDKPNTVLLDVRGQKLYTGEEGAWIRKGHIPGAISHPWTDDLTADGVWKGKQELQAAYAAQGITPDKFVITSCGQGQMSAHTYITLKYILGYPNVANYDGSFNEWSSVPELPVKTGDSP